MANTVVLRKGIHIGEISAEDDEQFLSQCFVQQPIFDQLIDINSSKSILLGRTGSGKTAIINEIERQKFGSTSRIDPKDVAFEYISNSNIVQFVIDIGCDVAVLFQYLWKHVLLSSSIEMYFKSKSSFETAIEQIFKPNNPARAYFEKYKDTFWIEQDVVIKEITEGFSQTLQAELKASIGDNRLAALQSNANAAQTMTGQEKREIQDRVKSAVDRIQIREMSRAIESLNQLMENKQKTFYIVIDELDLDWAPQKIKYLLIHALIDAIKNFRKIRNVKIVAAVRSDVFEKSLSSITGEGVQPEKYDSISVNVRWDSDSLSELIDKRIAYMFRKQYTRDNVKFVDLFNNPIRKTAPFDYLTERTLLRPRDLIVFVNTILDKASGAVTISPRIINESEPEYSRKRLEALRTEWRSVHPRIDDYLRILERRTGQNTISELLKTDEILELLFQLDNKSDADYFRDECSEAAERYLVNETDRALFEFAATLLSVLYKVGAVNLKLASHQPYINCYLNDAIVQSTQITSGASFMVTPMLWRALGITPNL